jgi:serine protease Do
MTVQQRMTIGAIVVALVATAALAPRVTAQPRGRDDRTPGSYPGFMMLQGPGSEIGITVRDPAADAPAGGVVVESVRAGGPAEKAGIRTGDIVTRFDGETVRSTRQFARLVDETPEGRNVSVTVLRDKRATDLTVTPVARQAGAFGERIREEVLRDVREHLPEFDFPGFITTSRTRLGVSVQNLTPQLAAYFGAKEGVLVSSVLEGSAAAKAGLRAGDVITAINGDPIRNPGDLVQRLRIADGSTEATIDIVRDKKPMSVKATVEAARDRRYVRPVRSI